jgi:hypothetical protein
MKGKPELSLDVHESVHHDVIMNITNNQQAGSDIGEYYQIL